MCNFNGNLVAWIDGELSAHNAADVEKHLQMCAECRRRVARCESLSRNFVAYYTMKNQTRPSPVCRGGVPQLAYVAAAAAVVLIATLIGLPRPDKKAPEAGPTAKVVTSAPVESLAEASPPVQPTPKAVAHHRVVRSAPRSEESPAVRTALQIAIPGEAIFPPGAVPEGVAYIASLAPDGSIQSIRLQP